MKRIIKKICEIIVWSVLFLLPIRKKKIVFSSFYGRGYGDNLKYIAEDLKNLADAQVKMYWVVSNENEARTLPSYIVPIKKNSISCVFHLLTSLVWIDNCRKPFVYKKKRQLYIQTWHGGGAQKRVEADVADKLDKGYVRMAKKDSKFVDLMISDSGFTTKLYSNSFWYCGPIYECGYPRYDPIIRNDEGIMKRVRKFFNIAANYAIALYVPTFRSNRTVSAYDVDFGRFIKNLETRFNRPFVLLIRLHPNVANQSNFITYNQRIMNATYYPDLQELLVAADVLLGDYSSCNYDFSLKKAPVFRYVNDLNDYYDDRGFYLKFEEYPFPYAHNNDELESVILNFNESEYKQRLESFFTKIGSKIEPCASHKVSELIRRYLTIKDKRLFFEENKNRFIISDDQS